MQQKIKTTEYLKTKLTLAAISLIVGVPALVFALFGWTQTTQHPILDSARYICILVSLGGMISGSLMLKETLTTRKTTTQPTKQPKIEFLVGMEYEDEQKNKQTHVKQVKRPQNKTKKC